MKQLTLKPEAFNDELLLQVKPGQLNWSSDEHLKFVESMVKHLVDENGKPVKLEGTRIDQTMRLIFRPTEELERLAWKQAFSDAGYELDAEADRTFLLLLNAAQFGKFLSKQENPKTGEPFIVLEKKKSVKKDTFASLMKAKQKEPVVETPSVPTTAAEQPAPMVVAGKKVEVTPAAKVEETATA